MVRRSAICLLTALALAGCGKDESKPASGGVEVNAPGVHVKVDGEGGTQVKAPGADVSVKPK